MPSQHFRVTSIWQCPTFLTVNDLPLPDSPRPMSRQGPLLSDGNWSAVELSCQDHRMCPSQCSLDRHPQTAKQELRMVQRLGVETVKAWGCVKEKERGGDESHLPIHIGGRGLPPSGCAASTPSRQTPHSLPSLQGSTAPSAVPHHGKQSQPRLPSLTHPA